MSKAKDVGIIVMGSQEERHGLLPEDIDTKIALYVASSAAARCGAKLVGIVNSAYEYEYLKHGKHHSLAAVVKDLQMIIVNSFERLGIKKFVIVNGHGGNLQVSDHLTGLGQVTDAEILFNNKVVELEGAHAASKECSMAVAAALVEESSLEMQGDFERFPEVGFVGFKEAHVNEEIKGLSEKTKKEGVRVNTELGLKLLEEAISSVVDSINSF